MGSWWDTFQARQRETHAATERIRMARETHAARIDAATELQRRRDAAAVERRIHATPQRHRRWTATPGPLTITDEAAPPPFWHRRAYPAGGPIIHADGGRTMLTPRLVAAQRPDLTTRPEFRGWAWDVAQRINDARQRHRGLDRLRDLELWDSILTAVGLTTEEVVPTAWEGNHAMGVRDDVVATVPVITGARVARGGLRIRFRPCAGSTLRSWQAAAPALGEQLLSAGFTVGDLAVSQHASGDIVLALNDTADAAAVVEAPRGVAAFDADNGRSYLGVDVATGEPVFITWANHAGLLIGGAPGGGKTGSTFPIIAGLAGAAELHVFDGKGGFDYEAFEPVATTFDASGDVAAPLETLRGIAETIPLRAKAIYTATGKKDFWKLTAAERAKHDLYPIFIVMDEAHTWLDQSGMDAAEKKAAVEIARHLRTLILKGRFVGITTILTTQKSDATAMPTRIRDNCSNRLCFRTTTTAHSTTILGAAGAEVADPSTFSAATPGRCVAVTDTGARVVQAAWADDGEIAQYLKDKTPVPSQEDVARRLLAGKG